MGDENPLQPPWRSSPRPAAPPRAQLSRDVIVSAALDVLDRDGADGLTMRAVAESLGASPAAIYGHVSNKEELIQLVLERVTEEFADFSEELFAREIGWQEKLVAFGEEARRTFLRHPGSAGLTLGRVPFGPSLLRIVEGQLKLLRAAGIPDQIAALVGDLFALYAGAYVFEEELAKPAGYGTSEVVTWLSSLPVEQFPNTVALADVLVRGTGEERYTLGLELLVRGLASYSKPA